MVGSVERKNSKDRPRLEYVRDKLPKLQKYEVKICKRTYWLITEEDAAFLNVNKCFFLLMIKLLKQSN